MITLKGLIIREQDRGEASKSVTVLTAERGIIHVFVRGGKKSGKNASPTQLFAYSLLCLEEKKNYKGEVDYFLNSCENIRIFYNLRLDTKKLALASYFCELLLFSGTENTECKEVMRLTLNTLHFLCEDRQDMELLKSVFEFRLLCEIGMRPKLLGCAKCMCYEDEHIHFNFLENNLLCDECYPDEDNIHHFVMDKTLLYIVRFIALTEYERLFSFKISPQYQNMLTEFTERFVSYNMKSKFTTLDFYKMI